MNLRYTQRVTKMLFYSFAFVRKIAKHKPHTAPFINNQNLCFQDQKYHLCLMPIYPQLTLKGKNTLLLSPERAILYLTFTDKDDDQKSQEQKKQKVHSFSFQYQQLSTFLEVEPYSNSSTSIVRSKKSSTSQIFQSLTLQDDPQNRQVVIHYRQADDPFSASSDRVTPFLTFNFAYPQYRVMRILLKKSLYDLSGSYLSQQTKRLDDIKQFNYDLDSKQKIKQQSKKYYQDDY